MERKRGTFLVFEGLDRSGKSTQSEKLVEALKADGEDVVFLKFPDRETPTGRVLNAYLKGIDGAPSCDQLVHLLFAANRWEKDAEISRALSEGKVVIADRYAFSGIAYSHGALGLDVEWCRSPDRGVIAPHKVFFLDVGDPSVCASRGGFGESSLSSLLLCLSLPSVRSTGDEVYEKLETQRRVLAAYRHFTDEKFWCPVDATRDPQAIGEEILRFARDTIAEKSEEGTTALPRLWTKTATK